MSIRKKFQGSWTTIRQKLFGCNTMQLHELQQRMETLEFIMKSVYPINKIPPATGNLRLMQLGTTALLKEVCGVLESKGIKIWLDSGTLLGAVRHGGFIPWDDDIDMGIHRADYEKATRTLQSALPSDKYSIIRSDCTRVIFKGTPCQIDLFPFDTYGVDDDSPTGIDELKKKIEAEHRANIVIDWNRLNTDGCVIANKTAEEVSEWAQKFVAGFQGPKKVCAVGVETKTFCILPESDIMPLRKINFEGIPFYAPAKIDTYLTNEFGDYMSYPSWIHLHQDIQNRMTVEAVTKICALAKEQGVSLDEVSYAI